MYFFSVILNLFCTYPQINPISGVTILAILEDTVERENTKELIYWNDENICKDSNMDHTDNIANVFLPQIMKVKESMIALKVEAADLESYISWVKVRNFTVFCEFDKILKKKELHTFIRTTYFWLANFEILFR